MTYLPHLPGKEFMILHDSFEWTNAAIGSTGLLLTIAAIVQATAAKKAAIEAREAVWRREASSTVAELVSLSLELASQLEGDRLQAAQTRARDLSARIARDQARFRRFFSQDFHLLVDLEKRFGEIAEQLSHPQLLTADVVLEMTNRVHAANRALNGICGRQESGLDKEAS
jgi:hypothetical protein